MRALSLRPMTLGGAKVCSTPVRVIGAIQFSGLSEPFVRLMATAGAVRRVSMDAANCSPDSDCQNTTRVLDKQKRVTPGSIHSSSVSCLPGNWKPGKCRMEHQKKGWPSLKGRPTLFHARGPERPHDAAQSESSKSDAIAIPCLNPRAISQHVAAGGKNEYTIGTRKKRCRTVSMSLDGSRVVRWRFRVILGKSAFLD